MMINFLLVSVVLEPLLTYWQAKTVSYTNFFARSEKEYIF